MVFITGATGFIGRSLQRALQGANIPYTLYEGRINDFVRLRDELLGVKTVIHLVGRERRGVAGPLQRTDVQGTETLIKALRFRPTQHLIIVSRINASPYAYQTLLRAKGQVEQLVKQSGFPYTIFRSATLFGTHDHLTNGLLKALRRVPLFFLPNGGTAAMQPLWVEDLARCLVQSLQRPDLLNKIVTVAGDEHHHYRDIVEQVMRTSRRFRPTYAIPLGWAYRLNQINNAFTLYPSISRFDLDRLAIPEVAPLNTVYDQFGFRPARLHHHLAHLRPKS